MKFKDPEGQVARWIEVLSSYQMTIEHRQGRSHGNADGLSRIPCRQCGLTDTEKQTPVVNHVKIDSSDTSEMKSLQAGDKSLAMVIECVQTKHRPPFADIAAESYVVKSLWNQFVRLEIQNEILIRNHLSSRNTEQGKKESFCFDIKAAGNLTL